MRIAQMIIAQTVPATFTVVAELSDTKRNDGGFGHTGL
jgi:dUTPase